MLEAASFHHVGIVVESIDAAIGAWGRFGYWADVRVSDPIQKADIVLLSHRANPTIELIAPQTPDSPAFTWIKRIKAGPYHTCFEVEGLEDAIAACGNRVVMAPVPAVAFDNRRVAFLWSKETGLYELLEYRK